MRTKEIAFAACFLLAGCATVPSPQLGDAQAIIAPKIVFSVPRPTALQQNVSVSQSIVAHFKEKSFFFDAQIQLKPGEFDFAALDGFGRRGLTVTWKAGGMVSQAAPWLPKTIRPADILADIALVYWPEEELTAPLAASGATLMQTGNSRKISSNGRDIVAVDYGPGKGWSRSAKLRNLAFGYEIDIQSVAIGP